MIHESQLHNNGLQQHTKNSRNWRTVRRMPEKKASPNIIPISFPILNDESSELLPHPRSKRKLGRSIPPSLPTTSLSWASINPHPPRKGGLYIFLPFLASLSPADLSNWGSLQDFVRGGVLWQLNTTEAGGIILLCENPWKSRYAKRSQ